MFFELTKEQRRILKILRDMDSSGNVFSDVDFYSMYAAAINKKKLPSARLLLSVEMDFSRIYAACLCLKAKGYIETLELVDSSDDLIKNITLSYKGKAYKELRNLVFYRFLFGSVLFPILLSIVTNLIMRSQAG